MIRTERKDPSHATEADVDGREGWLCPKIMMENTVGCASKSSMLDPTSFKVSYETNIISLRMKADKGTRTVACFITSSLSLFSDAADREGVRIRG